MVDTEKPTSASSQTSPPKKRRWLRLPWHGRVEPEEAAQRPPRRRRRFRLGARWRHDMATAKPKRVPWLRRTRTRTVVARLIGWGLVAVVALVLATYGAIRTFLTPDKLKDILTSQVEEQSGGRLEVGSVFFDVLSGLKLKDVKFYPPAVGDVRGSRHGGAVDPRVLGTFDVLDIRYSFPKLMAGRVYLNEAELVAPAVHLRQDDRVLSFQGILDYRAKRFPPSAVVTPTPQAPASGGSEGLLPFSPALIYLPFELLLRNVGIRSLSLDLVATEHGHVTQAVVVSGINLDVGAHWLGHDSDLWMALSSPFERPLKVDVETLDSAGQFHELASATAALQARFGLTNLQQVAVDASMRVTSLTAPGASFKDLGTYLRARVNLADDLKTLNFKTFEAELADVLSYELSGSVAVSDASLREITLKLTQQVSIDLGAAAQLARPFRPGFKADGSITVDDMKIDGVIQPALLAKAADGVGLPYVAGVVWLEDVAMEDPATGVKTGAISGSCSLAAGPALDGGGSQIDLNAEVDVPSASVEQKVGKLTVKAGVEHLAAKVTTRILWPELIAPVLKISVEAEHVRASGAKLAALDVPLLVDIDADGRKDLARLAFSANMELTDLAEMSAMADCQAKCTRFRASMQGRLAALEKLHQLVLPLGSLLGAGAFMPTKLNGAADFELSVRGKIPDPLATPPAELMAKGDVRFSSQLNLAKVNAQVPFDHVDLKNFETRLLASGSLSEQKIDVAEKFESLALSLPMGDGKPLQPISLNRFSVESSIENEIAGPLDLKKVMGQLTTGLEAKVFLGRVTAEGLLPRPMSDLQVTVDVAQQRLTDIQLKSLTVRVPDYGTNVDFAAQTVIGPDFMPKSLSAKLKTLIVHTGEEHLPGGIKTSGRMTVDLTLASPDLKTLAVDGMTEFEHFNITVPGKDPDAPALALVQDMRGQVPFKQTVRIPDLATLKKSPVAAVTATLAAAVAAPKAATKVDKPVDVSAVPLVTLPPEQDLGVAATTAGPVDKTVKSYLARTAQPAAPAPNLVAMVDYGEVRPFYPSRKPLAIGKVVAANLELDNMEFDLELEQGWFALNQFVIGFLGGKIEGDLQVAFDPNATNPQEIARSLRLAVHMTRLDMRKLLERFPNLKDKSGSWDLFSNPYIDGTVHLAFDFKSNDISGGVEITSIGKEQLKMMLYYVDPLEQNPNISDMRRALSFGEVRQVSIPLKNGEVGLDMDLRVLGAPIPTPKLSHFPISQILQNFKDQLSPAKDAPGTQPVVPNKSSLPG